MGEPPEVGRVPEGAESPGVSGVPEGAESPEAGEVPEGAEGSEPPEVGEVPKGAEAPEADEIPEDGPTEINYSGLDPRKGSRHRQYRFLTWGSKADETIEAPIGFG